MTFQITYFPPPFKLFRGAYIVDSKGHPCFQWLRLEGLTMEFKESVIDALNHKIRLSGRHWKMDEQYLTYDDKRVLKIDGWNYLTSAAFGCCNFTNGAAQVKQFELLIRATNTLNQVFEL